MNLFGTVLTYPAPSANYRGESEENRAVIQKITFGRFEYAIISPEALRNAVRETFAAMKLPCNRERLHDEEQLAVKFNDYPDSETFIDDYFMGWLIAAGKEERKKVIEELRKKGRNPDLFKFKRDSVLRMNMAVALEPYRYNSVFTQSPLDATPKEIKGQRNAESSQLLHRETSYTAFQYPFALNLDDCASKPEWTKALLNAIGQLNNVAGNHARSYFEMAPASIVLRWTQQLVAGFDNYGFQILDGKNVLPEIVEGISRGDYPGEEFYLGGKVVKDFDGDTENALKKKGVTLERNPQKLLDEMGERCCLGKKAQSDAGTIS